MSGFSIDIFVDRDDRPEFQPGRLLYVATDACLRLPAHETYRRVYLHRLLTAAEAAYREAGGWQAVLATRDDTTGDLLVDGKRYVLADEPEPEPTDTRDVVTVQSDARGESHWWTFVGHGGHCYAGLSRSSVAAAIAEARCIFGHRPNTRLDLGDES